MRTILLLVQFLFFNNTEPPVLKLSRAVLKFNCEAQQNDKVFVTSQDCTPTLSTSAQWVEVRLEENRVIVYCHQNNTVIERLAIITVKCGNLVKQIHLHQAGIPAS